MRRLAFHTGSRADESPLSSVIRLIDNPIHIKTEGLYGHEKYVKERLEESHPDLLVILGDRYETLVVATVAALLCIPIVHIHGGEETLGAADNAFRHAITKLSYYHFCIHEDFAKRLIQMGEHPTRVFVTGAPGVDLYATPPMSKMAVECALGFDNNGLELMHPMALVCYHPETLGADSFSWLDDLSLFKTVIISGANADPGNEIINATLSKRGIFRQSYSQHLWTSLMREADVLIGNSSGFIIEGMTIGKEIINIGDRQKGRYEEAKKHFAENPYAYGVPGLVSGKIAELIMSLPIPEKPRKAFYAG